MIRMKAPGTLEGQVGARGHVFEEHPTKDLSPGLLVKTLDSGNFSSNGIDPSTTPAIGAGGATEQIMLPGLLRQLEYKSNNAFLVKTGYPNDEVPVGTVNLLKYESSDGVYSPVTYVKIPYDCTSFGQYSFYNNTRLQTIDLNRKAGIGGHLTAIYDYCFAWCTSLSRFVLSSNDVDDFTAPISLSTIGTEAFAHTALTSFVIHGPGQDYGLDGELHQYNGLESIGPRAFQGCSNLVSIKSYKNRPPSYTESSFKNVHSDGVLEIPSLTYLEDWIWWAAANNLLEQGWVIKYGETVVWNRYCTDSAVFYKTSNKTELWNNEQEYEDRDIVVHYYDASVNIGVLNYASSKTGPGDFEYYGISSLTSINIPRTFTRIGDDAFAECSNITTFTIPSTITYLGEGAFDNCSRLTSVIFEEGSHITDILARTFNGTSLANMTLPPAIRYIHAAPWVSTYTMSYLRFTGNVVPAIHCFADGSF